MRTITASQALIYASPLGTRATWAKVEVYSTITSAWVDLSSYFGYNWVRSVTLTEEDNSKTQTASIELALLAGPSGEITSSPFVTSGLFSFPTGYSAYNALLMPYKQIRVSLAVTPIDTAPATADWMLKFRGRINDVDINEYSVRLTCRDEMGVLADTFIEDEREYGADDGSITVESVMQSILNAWGGSVKLWSPNGTAGSEFNAADTPSWAIRRYRQQRMNVMDALVRLADQVGYDLRFSWQTSAADLKLVMRAPVRVTPTVDRTFTMADFVDLKPSLSLTDIRNAWRVGYYVKSGAHHYTNTVSDATSVSAFGRRWAEIGESPTSQIDTSTEAVNLATRALSDTASPTVVVQATMPLFPNAELLDYYTVTGDDKIISTVSMGVRSVSHTVDETGGRTTLTLAGLPASRSNWAAAQQARDYSRAGFDNVKVTTAMYNLFSNGDVGQWSSG